MVLERFAHEPIIALETVKLLGYTGLVSGAANFAENFPMPTNPRLGIIGLVTGALLAGSAYCIEHHSALSQSHDGGVTAYED